MTVTHLRTGRLEGGYHVNLRLGTASSLLMDGKHSDFGGHAAAAFSLLTTTAHAYSSLRPPQTTTPSEFCLDRGIQKPSTVVLMCMVMVSWCIGTYYVKYTLILQVQVISTAVVLLMYSYTPTPPRFAILDQYGQRRAAGGRQPAAGGRQPAAAKPPCSSSIYHGTCYPYVKRITRGWVIDRSFTPIAQKVTPSHLASSAGHGFEPHFERFFYRNACACTPKKHISLVPQVMKRSG